MGRITSLFVWKVARQVDALGRPPKDFATFAREVAATELWRATA